MASYCGIDLHSTNNYLGVYDEPGRAIFAKRLPNDLRMILECLEPYRAEMVGIAAESTYKLVLAGRRADGMRLQGHRWPTLRATSSTAD